MIEHTQNKNIVIEAIKGEFDVIINFCNCFCNMNNKELAKAFPEVNKADLKTIKGDIFKLGEFSSCYYKNLDLTIFNIYTSYEYKVIPINFEYTAFALGLRNICAVLKGDEFIAIPKIEGVRWNILEQIIKRELVDFNVKIL
jgi:hypothetical protein